MTLPYPKMHAHTKFRIPISSITKDIPDTIFLKTRSTIKVMVTVTRKWYMTYHHPYSKFGIPTSKNIEDMHHSIPILETRSEVKVTVTQNGMRHSCIPRCIHTPNLGFLPPAPDMIILKTRVEVKVTVTR